MRYYAQQELERAIQEVWALFRETSERFKETDRRFKETDKRIERLSQETDKKIAEVSRSVAALTGKWGRFVEGLITPGTISMFKERGIGVEKVYQRVNDKKFRPKVW